MFLIGMVVGAALAWLTPRYVGPYLGVVLTPSVVVEGNVVEKEVQAERVVLKVSTPDGVLLASFTENRDDIDLLVELGSTLRLGANRYRPFLENPTILSVREPASPGGSDMTSAKKAYQETMEAALRKWEAKLAELEAIAAEATGDVGREYESELETLRKKRERVREKLSELQSASSVAWKDVKTGLDAAWKELDEALEAAAVRFRDPEASPESEAP